jgi:hypothetical protein
LWLFALGNSTDVNNITCTLSGGNTVTFGNVSGTAQLMWATLDLVANANSTTSLSFVYPEPNGQTALATSAFPMMFYYSAAGAVQPVSGFTLSNSSGTLTYIKTGLVANTAYFFRLNF